MNKNKLLIFIIAGLLVSNILLVVFMMKGRPHGGHGPDHRPMPREIIIERLHFDANQVKRYDTLIKKHRSDINGYQETLMSLKNNLYTNLKSKTDKPTIYFSIDAIAKVQSEIEHVHYAHFEDIKALCKPDQLGDFNKLVEELARLFAPPPPPKKHD